LADGGRAADDFRRLRQTLSHECRERTERALKQRTTDSGVSAPMLMQLNLEHGMALKLTVGSAERINAYLTKALMIAEQLGDVNGQLRVLWSVWAQDFLAGRWHDLQSCAERFYRVAARSDDPAALLASDRQIGAGLLLSGDLASAQARSFLAGSRLVCDPQALVGVSMVQACGACVMPPNRPPRYGAGRP